MTKTGLLAARAGGDDVADLHFLVRDDHPVDQQLDQLAALCEGRVGEAGMHPLAERRGAAHMGRDLPLVGRLRLEMCQLLPQPVAALFQFRPSPLVLGQREDPGQVCLGQAVELLLHVPLSLPHHFLPGAQFLGQPMPSLGAGQPVGDALGVREHGAQVPPNEIVELLRGDEACGAALIPVGEQRSLLGAAEVVHVAGAQGATGAGELADAATDEAAQ
jgi:hypothetical protein